MIKEKTCLLNSRNFENFRIEYSQQVRFVMKYYIKAYFIKLVNTIFLLKKYWKLYK